MNKYTLMPAKAYLGLLDYKLGDSFLHFVRMFDCVEF